jgi:RHS repeat-associated protein
VGNNDHMSGFGYDAAGNLTQNGSVTFTYDAENRLIWTNASGGFSYLYDGDGSRVEKCSSSQAGVCPNGSTAILYWRDTDGGDALVETDQTGAIQNQYIFFNGNRIARLDGSGNIHYYFSDHLGSHAVVENSTGSVCEQDIDYYPYGGVQKDYCAVAPQNYKFTGVERDGESGLDLMKARNYSSSLGRMLTPDPGHADGFAHKGDPESWNPYAYAGNNPLRFIDPSGLAHCEFRDSGSNSTGKSPEGQAEEYRDLGNGVVGGIDTKATCDTAGGELVLDSDDQGVKTETVDVKATYTTTEEYIDNVAWFINYAGEQTFGRGLGAFGTMMQTNDPIDFALSAAVVITPMKFGGASGTAERSALLKATKSAKLRNIIIDLFKGAGKAGAIGDGTTMDAIRYELATGGLVQGKDHVMKGIQYRSALMKVLRDKSADPGDRAIAKKLLINLQSALSKQ